MGHGNGVQNTHVNLDLMYPKSPQKMYQVIADNLERRYFQKKYKKCTNDGEKSGHDITITFDEFYKKLKGNFNRDEERVEAALEMVRKELRNPSSKLYLRYNKIAQTRIVASYGLVQQTYYDAVRENHTKCLHKLYK